jgi:hypothetical protein
VKFSLGSLGFGGTIEGQQRNNYFFSWDDAHLYWFNSLSIDPVVDYQFSLCKSWNGSLSIELALLSFVSRPTLFKMNKQDAMTKFGFYFYETNKDASFELPDDYQHLCVDLGVNHVLHRSSVYIGYKFTLDRYQQPAPVIAVSHGLVVKQFFGRTASR